jgi:uncharacterized repeat protein (TIGR03803 family)
VNTFTIPAAIRAGVTLAIASALLLVAARLAQAQTETVLYSFGSNSADGARPLSGLVSDKRGNLYGTTEWGGSYFQGTVFKVTPAGDETVLYNFGSQSGDGMNPYAGLVLDKQGNLYGTTCCGGSYGYGTVFKLTPAGLEAVLYSFGSQIADGRYLYAGLVLDKQDNLYGATYSGGAYGYGTVFKLTPAGQETVLYSFQCQSGDGCGPAGALVFDKKDNLYGTTVGGGGPNNPGTVFMLTPAGNETVLHSFGAQSEDGHHPYGGLIFDKQGNLYGTTCCGGVHGYGTVFKLTLAGSETVLYSFGSVPGDGHGPNAALVFDKQGNLYGTTSAGGVNPGAFHLYDQGTVFKITPTGTETVIYNFGVATGDAFSPGGSLVFDKKGHLYGTTAYGGAQGGVYGEGSVFKLTP